MVLGRGLARTSWGGSPSSVTIPLTPADIVTFDTAGLLGYPLLGDTTNPAPLGTGISYAAPRHGYLFVENLDGSYFEASYWLELDLANGGAHGDAALRNFGTFVNAEGDFAFGSGIEILFGPGPGYFQPVHAMSAGRWTGRPAAFWPSSVASTVFTVTPLGTEMITNENNQVVMQVLNSDAMQGAYDRNENGIDGTVPVTVRCVARLTPAQPMIAKIIRRFPKKIPWHSSPRVTFFIIT